MANDKVTVIRKTFDEAVSEIRMHERNLKEVISRPPSEEGGKPIEMLSMSFGEASAEIERLMLVKKLSAKGRKSL